MDQPDSQDSLLAAKRKLSGQVRGLAGIEGCGTDGQNLRVYVSDFSVTAQLPREVDGISVTIVPSGHIHAQAS